MDSSEVYNLLLFNRITNYSPRKKLELFLKYRNYNEIFRNRKEIERINGKSFKVGGYSLDATVLNYQKKIVEREIDYYTKENISIIDYSSPIYPKSLKNIYDPPVVLFAKGNIKLLKSKIKLAIVGSRKATNRGLTSSYVISRTLSDMEITIVSGLAKGVDSYAHKGALTGSGSTIAIMATGMDHCYPPFNSDLLDEINKKGLVLTEFPMGMLPLKYNFPKRNRIISGLADATLVAEASEKSGALITAGYALDQGKEVMALPGKAGSEFFSGNNLLIKEGAYLVENSSDILNLLDKDNKKAKKFVETDKNSKLVYSDIENDVLLIIGDDTVSFEDINKNLTYPISKLISTLIMLEIKGIVRQKAGKYFYRVR